MTSLFRDKNLRAPWLTIAVFAGLLWLPLGASLWQSDLDRSPSERRRLASLPLPGSSLADWESFPRRLTDYYDDQIAFRIPLIRSYAWLHIRALGQAPVQDLIYGKDGWFFLGDAQAIDQHRGVARSSPDELAAWSRALQARSNWLAARGSAYLLVLVPNKHTIYGEMLPDHLRPVSTHSQLGALADYLRKHTSVAVLDLRETLDRARSEEPTHHKTDTHWNDYGAYAASGAILEALKQHFAGFENLALPDVTRRTVTGPGLGLPQSLGLARAFPQARTRITPRRPAARVAPEFRTSYDERVVHQRPFAFQVDDNRLPKAVILRDSFANALIPFLSESFRRTLYVWTRDWPERILEHEMPEVVIQEIAERFLWDVPGDIKGAGSGAADQRPGSTGR